MTRYAGPPPLWYKDAIIYELHVKAFFDGNNDGIGDFPGLIQRLDYLQGLGVTCLWLLPFFPSPLRDDGYDIADYRSVHPSYGTMEDFQAFLEAAHGRDLQVMIELVLNHTSDQHPWFQAARHAPPGSPERDFYVWSDTDRKYADARIIFTDTEASNWTWDPVAKAYYWHRFFSHQPDLNFDNPAVVDAMLDVMRFWLDRGVDGLRLDAIPFLIERDGTSCANLPETHALIKRIRRAMDDGYANRVILAEANQWPSDVRPYFGDGDECHMAFHFPLMPRIFMALRLEDRLPVTEIMAKTPDIPDSCQWGLFLRNHDELTLEMISDEERDYMYLAYSADPRMRLNAGIRRRLAPLMDNNRRRIELLQSLLFSFPGTPILYYGDEIGMGDNIYLGDRNGVRTPMQWNADRNAGFSRATPAKLYSPVVMDPVYGYEAINVEAQLTDASSPLSWMRNMIALRKLVRVFGRGSLEFLRPANRKVLAYLRHGERDEHVLCVANLSRFAQPTELDLSAFEGLTPVEMLGYVEFPRIGRGPYPLTLGPYGFLWFELQRMPAPAPSTHELLDVAGGWPGLPDGPARSDLEGRVLPAYLPAQRWFGGKSRRVRSTRVADWAELEPEGAALVFVEVAYDGGGDAYVVPMALDFDDREIPQAAVLCPVTGPRGSGVLYDALHDDQACATLFEAIATSRRIATRHGELRGIPSRVFADLRGRPGTPLPTARSPAEQSKTSVRYGNRLTLELFRRYQQGPNPGCEIGRYLTEQAPFPRVSAFGGVIKYVPADGEPADVAMLLGIVPNQGDGWTWTLEELHRYYENVSTIPFAAGAWASTDRSLVDGPARDHIGMSLGAAAALGRLTAGLHLALTQPTDDPAFRPETMTADRCRAMAVAMRERASEALAALEDNLPRLPDDLVEPAGLVLSRRRRIVAGFEQLSTSTLDVMQTRIHGDYHLGQVLRVEGDYVILDFEGEPTRPLDERRAKQSPLKDVAGMMRSLSYAAGLLSYTARHPDDVARLTPWARLWDATMSAEFLRAYRQPAAGAPFLPPPPLLGILLDAFLLEKALHELLSELISRPPWVRIPLEGLLLLSGDASSFEGDHELGGG